MTSKDHQPSNTGIPRSSQLFFDYLIVVTLFRCTVSSFRNKAVGVEFNCDPLIFPTAVKNISHRLHNDCSLLNLSVYFLVSLPCGYTLARRHTSDFRRETAILTSEIQISRIVFPLTSTNSSPDHYPFNLGPSNFSVSPSGFLFQLKLSEGGSRVAGVNVVGTGE